MWMEKSGRTEAFLLDRHLHHVFAGEIWAEAERLAGSVSKNHKIAVCGAAVHLHHRSA